MKKLFCREEERITWDLSCIVEIDCAQRVVQKAKKLTDTFLNLVGETIVRWEHKDD